MFLEIATTTGALGVAFLAARVSTGAIAVVFGFALLLSAYPELCPRRSQPVKERTDLLETRLKMDGSYPTYK